MMKRFNFIASTLAKSALAVSFLFCAGILDAQNHTAADSTAAHAVATTATAEYAYDANGNMTRDANRGICKIEYNCLNLPNLIVFANGDSIQNTYAADGTKLQTVRKTGGKTTTTDYCGNAVYVDGELKMLLNDYGYVSMPDRKFHFYIRDAQGNVRVVADAEGNVEEVNDYYPSGTLMPGTAPNNTQPYKYNGKELDRSAGLNLYDYGARLYDPTIGRFTTPDPLAEKYYPYSPYGYCLGNPVRYIDPNGKSVWDFILGTLHSINSNLTIGLISPSANVAISNARDYNLGRTAGNIASVGMGMAEIFKGGSTAIGGTFATFGTAGTASPASIPMTMAGAGMVAHGSAVVGKSVADLMSSESFSPMTATKSNGKSAHLSSEKQQPKSLNQLNKDIQKGNTPKDIMRFDKAHTKGGQEHVHFKDGSALNKDGTWKEGDFKITKEIQEYLKENGWKFNQ